jgi:hypothetical protein
MEKGNGIGGIKWRVCIMIDKEILHLLVDRVSLAEKHVVDQPLFGTV